MASEVQELVTAARDGNIKGVQKALNSGADINASWGDTALTGATERGRIEVVQYLLERGASIYSTNGSGHAPLQIAKERGQDHIYAMLKQEEFARLAKETVEWSLFGSTKLVHVEISPVTARKLTEIFNFESRERLMISENLQTGVEATLPPVGFETLPEATLDKALEKFTSLGGVADENWALKGKQSLRKTL